MPSAKPRISVTITDPLAKTLETLWRNYPDLKGSLLESIQFLMIYGAEAIERDRKILSRGTPLNELPNLTAVPQVAEVPVEDETPNPDDEWA
ncbi:MAG: hypothetical protein KME18_07660 [Phormidium tanganyikae FI6-MK23]|jgi:hypothetical protein|nr:hypothetical protein [Phormidium tanganyikae FI6-MK23]